jgi:hypothetical protein
MYRSLGKLKVPELRFQVFWRLGRDSAAENPAGAEVT